MHALRIVALMFVLIYLIGCSPEYTKRYNEPLTYAEAQKKRDIDFPLPQSSRNIYYGMYADWQAYTLLVRFEAPVEDCLKHIKTVLDWHNAMHKRSSTYPSVEVTSVEDPGTGWLAPAPWFTPETITRGVYTGESSSHAPQIWVDLDRGIFYFKVTD